MHLPQFVQVFEGIVAVDATHAYDTVTRLRDGGPRVITGSRYCSLPDYGKISSISTFDQSRLKVPPTQITAVGMVDAEEPTLLVSGISCLVDIPPWTIDVNISPRLQTVQICVTDMAGDFKRADQGCLLVDQFRQLMPLTVGGVICK